MHIASHGSSNCAILRDSASGDDYEFSLEDLVRIQTAQGPFSPLLVVLNTCSGSQRKSVSSISSHSRFTNLAHALLAGGVRCVISSTARVHDSIAQEIMTNFYQYDHVILK